jgi:hypothetical protein
MANESPSGIEIYRSHPWNLIKTGFLVLTWIALVGIFFKRLNDIVIGFSFEGISSGNSCSDYDNSCSKYWSSL